MRATARFQKVLNHHKLLKYQRRFGLNQLILQKKHALYVVISMRDYKNLKNLSNASINFTLNALISGYQMRKDVQCVTKKFRYEYRVSRYKCND